MKQIKLVTRRLVQMIVSSFTMMVIMDKLFSDLPIANYLGVYTFGAMAIWALLVSYEAPTEKKRPQGNYFKDASK